MFDKYFILISEIVKSDTFNLKNQAITFAYFYLSSTCHGINYLKLFFLVSGIPARKQQ